ncbi:MAG: diguanylate cyclase, partial [Aquificaceae bacterium]|nr:diguanylate cyclase [Aquificaceae bacterium]
YLETKSLNSFYRYKAEEIELVWKTATIANMEAIASYYSKLMDRETIQILKLARSGEEKDLILARKKLLAHLWSRYEILREGYGVKGLIFVTPDNRVLIRLHAPHVYGDDFSQVYPALKNLRDSKQPTHGFAILRLVSGYAYAFPVIDENGEYLGAVVMVRNSGTILENLHLANPDWLYAVVLNKSLVEERMLEEYRYAYEPLPGSERWVYDSYDDYYKSITNRLAERMGLSMESVFKSPEFVKLVSSENSGSVLIKGDIVVTFLKLYEQGVKEPSALLLGFHKEPFISAVGQTHKLYSLASLLFLEGLILSLYIFTLKARQVQVQAKELELISDYVSAGLIIADEQNRIHLANAHAHRMLGYSERELKNKTLDEVILNCEPMEEGEKQWIECKLKKEDGTFIYVQLEPRRIQIDRRLVNILTFFDITERKEKEMVLKTMSNTDALTGLYNRRFIYSRLIEEKERADKHQSTFSTIFADVDNFKNINDTYGHAMGDRVLIEVAHKIKYCIRVDDVVARWGGEEFLILLPNVGLKGAEALAERIRKSVQEINILGVDGITISLGVATYRLGESIDELISRADHALYTAKREGKNRVVVHV